MTLFIYYALFTLIKGFETDTRIFKYYGLECVNVDTLYYEDAFLLGSLVMVCMLYLKKFHVYHKAIWQHDSIFFLRPRWN